jgi:hypothetical protein
VEGRDGDDTALNGAIFYCCTMVCKLIYKSYRLIIIIIIIIMWRANHPSSQHMLNYEGRSSTCSSKRHKQIIWCIWWQ